MFERSTEKWTKSFTFKDAFISQILAWARFVRPGANFNRAKIEKEFNMIGSVGRKPELSFLSPPTTPSVSESSVGVKYANV